MPNYGAVIDAEQRGRARRAPAANRYQTIVDDEVQQQARLNVMVSASNPDEVARAGRLARETGLPAETVERNLPDIETRVQQAQARQAMADDPKLAAWAADPYHVRVGLDDVPTFRSVNKLFGSISEQRQPKPTLGSVLSGIGTAFTEGASGARAALRSIASDLMGDTSEADYQIKLAARAAGRVEQTTPAFQSRTARGLYSGASSLAQQAPAMALSVATANPAPSLVSAGAHSGLPAYAKYRARGATRGEAAVGGVAEGAVEVATELLPMKHFVDGFGKVGFGRFVSGLLGKDVPGEQVATLVQDAIDTAIANPDKTWADYLAERPGAAYETAVATLVPNLFVGGTSELARFAGERERAKQAESDAAFLDALASGATESKTRARDPSAFARFLELQAEGSPVDKLFVPAETVAQFYQSQGLDWQSNDDPYFGSFQADFGEQMRQGLATGGDLVVSTADFAAHLAGTPAWDALKDDLRARPDGLSLNEARSFGEAEADALEASGRELSAQLEADRAAAEPAQRVYEDVLSKARAAGFTVEAATSYAALYSQRYATRAARSGGDAWEAYQSSGIELRQVLPERLASVVAADNLDILTNAMKRGGTALAPSQLLGPSLLEFIAKRGGIEDRGGELAGMDADKWHREKKFRKKLLREVAVDQGPALLGGETGSAEGIDFTPDGVAMAAWEQGYFPDFAERPTVDDLLQAIDRELRGQPVYRPSEMGDVTTDAGMKAAAEELREIVERAGLDPDTVTAAEVRAAVAAFQVEAMADGGFDQAPQPIATLSGEEIAPADVELADLRAAARTWFAENLKGTTVASTALGSEVRFGKSKKALSASADPRKLRLFAALPDLIAGAELVDTQPDRRGDPQVKAWHFLRGVVELAGERLAVTLSVREDTNGNFYYNHVLEDGDPAPGTRLAARKATAGTEDGGAAYDQDIPEKADNLNVEVRTLNESSRGRITFDQGRAIIELFEGRDLSTLIHETGHLWLEELRADATAEGASEQLKADWQAVQDWFAANGHAVGKTIPVEAHELWARGVERFVMEGKAPSSALRRAFDAFRSWLLTIYQLVDNLRAPITPEIRDVMRRLVATDEALAAAEQDAATTLLFTDAAAAGMTDAEYAAYLESAEAARTEAYDALLFRTMAAIRKARTAEWKDAERAVRDEVTTRVDALPAFRALKLLRAGKDVEGAAKLSRQALVDAYGADALAMLPKGVPPIYADTGVAPDIVAEMVGLRSGDELVKLLMGIEARQRELRDAGDKRSVRQAIIDAETAQLMGERFGDPLADGSIEEEARAAIHNDVRATVIASEARALARRTGATPTPYRLARQWAARVIAGKSVRDGATPAALDRYLRAEAKAARAAEKAILAGDVDEAFRQKQAHLLNHALYAEAKAAADLVDSAVKRLSRLAKKKTSPTIDQDYYDQVTALLERYDFKPASARTVERRQSLAEWAAERQAQGFDVNVPPKLLLEAGRQNYLTLTVEELLGLRQTIDQIVHLGRLKQKLLDAKEQREFDAVVDEAVASVEALPQRKVSNNMEPTALEKAKAFLRSADAMLLKVEALVDWLDNGNPNGVFNRVVWRRMSEAQTKEREMLVDYTGRLDALMQTLSKEQVRDWQRKVDTPELINRDTGEPWVLTKDQVIAMALNSGNEGNYQRLLDGYGWSDAAVQAVFDRVLTADDWRYVQGVWDVIETLWPEIAALEKRLNGVEPEKVEVREVVNRHGTFRGGYYPAVYDPLKDLTSAEKADASGDALFENSYTRATTPKGFTKARSEQVKRPIMLSLGVVPRHIGEVIHDLAFREAVIDADRFLSDRRVAKAITDAMGPEYARIFRPWLQGIANEWARDQKTPAAIERLLRHTRTSTTIVGLGFRASTVMMQALGYSNVVEVIGAKWLGIGFAKFGKNPAAAYADVMERSGELRGRFDTLDRDIRENARRYAGRTDLVGAVRRFAFYGIGYADLAVVVPTWIGAYNKALTEGMSETDAGFYADKVVRTSQGAGAAKDLAQIMRSGEAVRLFTIFYSYFSALYARQRTLVRDVSAAASEGRVRDLPRLMARAWWLLVVPTIGQALLSGHGPEEEEDPAWWAFRKVLLGNLGSIPGVRDIAGALDSGFGYTFSPAARVGETVVRAITDLGKAVDPDDEPSSKWLKNGLETAGYVLKLPTGQIATAAQFVSDVTEGEQDPEGLADWWQGLTRGKLEE